MNSNAGPAVTAERIDAQLRELSRRVTQVSADFTAFTRTVPDEPAQPRVQYATPESPAAGRTGDDTAQWAPQAGQQEHHYAQAQAQAQYQQAPYQQGQFQQGWYQQSPYQQGQYPAAYYPHQQHSPQYSHAGYGYGPPQPAPYAPQPPYPRAGGRPNPPAERGTMAERLTSAAERGLVGRVLAAFGVGITLIGIVLLLILAAQAGLLRPEVRVAGGAVVAAGLFAAGVRIGRREQKRSGALALVATGIAAALFDVLACAAIYHWLPAVAAVLIGGAIAGVGLTVAHRWDSQALCLMVSAALLVFAPVITAGVDEVLIGFALVYAASVLWLQRGRDWTAVFLVDTAAVTAPLLAAGTADAIPGWYFGTAVAAGLALALVSALLLLPSSTRPISIALGSAAAALPVAALPAVLDRPASAAVAAVCTLLLIAAALGTAHHAPVTEGCRSVWLTAAALVTPVTIAYAATDDSAAAALLGTSLVAAIAVRHAGALHKSLLIIATVIAGIGLLVMVCTGALEQLAIADALDGPRRVGMLIAACIAIAAVGTLTAGWASQPRIRPERCWPVGGMACLWLLTQVSLGTGQLITGGTDSGFRAGHTAATLLWFAAAAAALIRARALHGRTRAILLTGGLVVIIAAIGKLILFDLAALDGIFRVVAFVVAGLVLLVLGVVYAQSLTGDAAADRGGEENAGSRPDAPAGAGH